MEWNDCRLAFHQDGSLRDIYFIDSTMAHWEKLHEFVRDRHLEFTYMRDGDSTRLPLMAANVFADKNSSHCLLIELGTIIIACHYFTVDEIELDIDPREIGTQTEFERLLSFIRELGTHLQRDAIMTEENSENDVWFIYSCRSNEFHYIGAPRGIERT